MSIRSIISKFVAQICEKDYKSANSTLDNIVSEKVKTRIKMTAESQKSKKQKAMGKTISKEMKKGRPQKQAVAIAFSKDGNKKTVKKGTKASK
jgi:hypothetical protein